MKSSIAVCLLSLAIVALARPDDKYSDKYDNTNLEEIMKNERTWQAYAACLLSKGPCTAEGKELKEKIPEALQNNCAKCTDKQRDGVRTIVKFAMDEHPDVWKELLDVYDPKREYITQYKKELEEIKSGSK